MKLCNKKKILSSIKKNLRIDELYNLNDDEFNKQKQEGVAKRVGN